jgi:hypothetical protein
MLATAHVTSGAVIGGMVGKPLPAFAIGAISHVVLDACPHWGMDVGAPGGRQRFLAVAAADGITLTAVLAIMVHRKRPAAELAGSLGALLLDLDKPAAELGVRQLWPDRLHDLHLGVQTRESPSRWRVDATVTLASLALLWLRRPRARCGPRAAAS